MYVVPVDGASAPIYAGDTITYHYTVLDHDGSSFTGTIVDARFELMQNVEGIPLPLDPAVVKTLTDGINILSVPPDVILEVILVSGDTASLPAACYTSAMRARSADFGDLTTIRRLHLEANPWS